MGVMMKNSGIEWVGLIPETWNTIANKYVMKKQKRICDKWSGEDVLSLTLNGVIVRDLINPSGKMPATFDGYQFAYDGELLMCLFDIDVTPRCVGRVITNGVTSPAYSCFKLYDGFDVGYYYYYYLMVDHTKELLHLAKNLRHSFTEDQLGVLKVPVPSLEEQKRIANFLDTECNKINLVIEKTKTSIEEYKKLKQSVITEAVTRGVRGKQETIESGLEWIEKIPKGWGCTKLKGYFDFGKGLPITKDNLVESGVPVISYGQIHSKINSGVTVKDELLRFVDKLYCETNPSSLVLPGDIIMADTSEDLSGCGNCVYVDKKMTLFAGYHTIILRSPNEECSKYIGYLFLSDAWRSQIRLRVSGIKLFSITQKILREITMILPSADEQNEIVKYLDEKCAGIDAIIESKTKLIGELENVRKSLIYEYVTGKKVVK